MTDKSHLLGFGYAPGEYGHGKCDDCEQSFIGDKYARRCEACAETLYSQVSSVEAVADKHRAMTTVPEEAVKAAAKCYLERTVSINETSSSLAHAMLTAALPHLPGVGVEKLEWVNNWGNIKAETPIGHYFIESRPDGSFDIRLENIWNTWASSTEAAKAAAQADFDANVLPLVHSQAEELWAAEREKSLFFKTAMETAQTFCGLKDKTIASLEADNAALTAKLETANALVACCCGDPVDAHNMGSGHSPVDQYHYAFMQLEAKLAAAEKALEFYADRSKWNDGYFKSEDDGAVLRAYPSSIENDQGDKARAALGGKPS